MQTKAETILTISLKILSVLLYHVGQAFLDINKIVLDVLLSLHPKRHAVSAEFTTIIDGVRQRVIHMFLKNTNNLPLSVSFKDASGNVAAVDGAPEWAVTDASLAELVVSPDGMSAVLSPLGPVGALKVQVKVDADLGEGVKVILGELDVDVLGGEAVTVEIAAGEPVPK